MNRKNTIKENIMLAAIILLAVSFFLLVVSVIMHVVLESYLDLFSKN